MNPLPAAAVVLGLASAVASAASPTSANDDDFAVFQREVSPRVLAVRPCDPRHWRQIEPAVHHLAQQHASRLASLADDERIATIARLAGFIDSVRDADGDRPVLAPGRAVIGLLDPNRGLGPKEITAIAGAYGATTTIFKRDEPDETIAGVATDFLSAVTEAAAATRPLTIVVLGHGLPTEIQSYSIRFERFVDALVDGAIRRPADAGRAVDFTDVVVVCDDCFSADFLINVLSRVESQCRDRGLALTSLPACIAGTNRDHYGHAEVGEKFVPHFWRDVIELYFIRRPRPAAVTLCNFFDNVDNMMYGYGRTPIVEGTHVAGWRLVDPDLVQDPVVFVPLSTEQHARLREILGLEADAPLATWLDLG